MTVHLHVLRSRKTAVCTACAVRFAWTNLGVNAALALLKAVIGVLAGSRALVAASMYSINDVLSAIAVIVSLKMASRAPDEEHPFGKGKVEYMAIGVVAVLLCLSVCFFVYSLFEIVHGSKEPPRAVAICVAFLSFGACELLARRGFCVAERLDSPALHTSAEHNRSDAIASLAVMGGLAAAAFGIHIVDRLVAVYEAIDVAHLSGVLLGRSINGLMDAALPPEKVEVVRRACMMIPGVIGVETIRSRRSGSAVWVDIIVNVAAERSVEETHAITARISPVVEAAMGRRVSTQVGFRAARAFVPTGEEAAANA